MPPTTGDGARPLYGLPPSAAAHLLARHAAARPAPWLVLVPGNGAATQLHADLAFFCERLGLAPPLLFPAWDNLPHEFTSPLPEISGRRMAALAACRDQKFPLLVAPVAAVLHRLPPLDAAAAHTLWLERGTRLDPATLATRLVAMGYREVPQVEQAGTYALRADILDVFPPQADPRSEHPYRIELFGDEVDSLKRFDPATQRSLGPGEQSPLRVCIPPVTELPLDAALVAIARQRVYDIAMQRQLDAPSVTLETGRIARTPRADGIETWAPFFFDTPMPTLTGYLPAGLHVALVDAEIVRARARGLSRKAAEAMAGEAARGTVVPEVAELFVTLDDLLTGHPQLAVESHPAPDREHQKDAIPEPYAWRTPEDLGLPPLEGAQGRGGFAPRFQRLAELATAGPVTVVCPDPERVAALNGILAEHRVAVGGGPGQVNLVNGGLSRGFATPDETFLTESELFGRQSPPPPPRRSRLAAFQTGFADLSPGDPLVHLTHGIGLYRGLKRMTVGDSEGDYLEIEYLGGDRVYVPMDRLELVQRYAGAEGTVPRLDQMGGKSWERTKRKVRRDLSELAGELVALAAAREVAKGHPFAPEGAAGVEFSASFPYTETADQMRTIEEIRADMERPRPMDRLVCGDVGYGKTEVALRAAFKAMLDGRQVVLLCPTTLLARQHYQTCSRRFDAWPFHIAQLSRFVPTREQNQTFKGLENGTVDMVIATHRLLTKEIPFYRLGLVIVDEEQRFGVTHKERLKQWKTSVDVLTLTATPIPRTLQLSLIGVRDLSVIDTPPPDRLAVQTRISRFDPTLIAEVIERELARDGQVFFIHNRVKDIGGMAQFLAKLIPTARIGVAHGQMPERNLEEVMRRFVDGETNILVSTSIVESGLDIPRANTIIINRADHFGLAELYQLRGRVGRSGRQAYAYLLGPEDGWTGEARERLMSIQQFTELGSGFRIAARDLEIRGAGSLLGHRQSGQIAQVGIDTYMHLIREAMAQVRGETLTTEFETTVRLGAAAEIPEDYVREGGVRLALYKRLSGCIDEAGVDALAEELADRFGSLPDALTPLLDAQRLKAVARRLRANEIGHAGNGRYQVTFAPDHTLSEVGLRLLLERFGKRLRFTSERSFMVDLGATPEQGGVAALLNLLREL
ncbi:MAG: transcription-repair coupling factor [Nitrospirota bacterium]|nr:transcription-repair coupling factor [Nitrospirota bacterium]